MFKKGGAMSALAPRRLLDCTISCCNVTDHYTTSTKNKIHKIFQVFTQEIKGIPHPILRISNKKWLPSLSTDE